MNYLFCDLDDTLFQSRRKTPDTPGITIAAHGPDGVPNAFMTAGQRKAFDAMLGAMTPTWCTRPVRRVWAAESGW